MTRLARGRNVLFGAGVAAGLIFGAAQAGASVHRVPVTNTAEECQALCAYHGYNDYTWDSDTGACHCFNS